MVFKDHLNLTDLIKSVAIYSLSKNQHSWCWLWSFLRHIAKWYRNVMNRSSQSWYQWSQRWGFSLVNEAQYWALIGWWLPVTNHSVYRYFLPFVTNLPHLIWMGLTWPPALHSAPLHNHINMSVLELLFWNAGRNSFTNIEEAIWSQARD